MNNLATSAAMGLTPIRHNSFTVPASVGQAAIRPAAVTLIGAVATKLAASLSIVTLAALPKWVVPGAVVEIAASATAALDAPLNGGFVVQSVNAGAKTFVVNGAGVRHLQLGAITLTAGALALRCECQRAIITPAGGPVVIAPFAGADWAATISDGQHWEILAPQGAKFDLSAWVYSGAAANILIL